MALFYSFTPEYYSTVCGYAYHVFIHASVNIHLSYFHVLAIIYSAAMDTGMHVYFQILVFSGYMPRSGIAGSYGNSIFSFYGTSILFSIVAAPIHIPINSVGGFPLLQTLSITYYL